MWSLRGHTAQRCEQIRERVSLGADDGLSTFERVVVDRHLASCAACSEFASTVRGFTAALRAAPLEPLPRPVVLPARRTALSGGLRAVAAAAVVAVAVGASSLTSLVGDEGPAARVNARGVSVDVDPVRLRERQWQQRLERTQPEPQVTDQRSAGKQLA